MGGHVFFAWRMLMVSAAVLQATSLYSCSVNKAQVGRCSERGAWE